MELKKAFRQGAGGAEERRLQADACLALKLHEEALQALEQSLALEPDNEEALLAKANTLLPVPPLPGGPGLHRPRSCPASRRTPPWPTWPGACEYSLGNWERGLETYRRAAGARAGVAPVPGQPGPRAGAPGRDGEALQAYLGAARLLFRAETYDELSLVLARGRAGWRGRAAGAEATPEARELAAYEAKMLFHEEKRDEAERLLRRLVQAGYPGPGRALPVRPDPHRPGRARRRPRRTWRAPRSWSLPSPCTGSAWRRTDTCWAATRAKPWSGPSPWTRRTRGSTT